MQDHEEFDFEWLTWRRIRVLAGLAALRTERQVAEEAGIAYSSVRGTVEAIKQYTGLPNVREIGRWWLDAVPKWLAWAAEQAGLQLKGDGS